MKRKSRLVAPWHRLLATAVGLPAIMALVGFAAMVPGFAIAHVSDFLAAVSGGR